MFEPPNINQELNQSVWMPGYPWANPAHLISAFTGPHGPPPWSTYALPYLNCYPGTIEAPDIPRGHGTHTFKPIQVGTVRGYGQAPTSGIYTGVEDVCG